MKLLSLFAALMLVGCAGYQNKITDKNPISDFPPDYGVIVGSLVGEKAAEAGVFGGDRVYDPYERSFYFKNVASGEEYIIKADYQLFGSLGFKNTDDENSSDVLFAYALPAGKYSIYNLRLFINNGMVAKSWFAKEKFDIPFEVTSGATHYIGEIRSIPRFGENAFGIEIPAGGHFEISDQSVRDVPALQQKYPNLNWDNALNSTLRSGNVPESLVKFK